MVGEGAIEIQVYFFILAFILAILELEERLLRQPRPNDLPEVIEDSLSHQSNHLLLALLTRVPQVFQVRHDLLPTLEPLLLALAIRQVAHKFILTFLLLKPIPVVAPAVRLKDRTHYIVGL